MGYTPPITNWYFPANNAAAYQNRSNIQQQTTTSLDPSLPSFQPGGMDIQRYQAPPPQPVSNFAMVDMQRRFVEMNVSHTSDFVKLSRQQAQTAQEVEETKETCRTDLQYLERKVTELEKKVSGSQVQTLRTNDDFSPSQEMLDQFSKKGIAEAFLSEADEMLEIVEKLREQAEAMHPGILSRGWPAVKMLEAPPASEAGASPLAAYACCELVLPNLLALLKHVDSEHTKHDSAHGSPARGRSGTARSRAIEIKAPESAQRARQVPVMKKENPKTQVPIPEVWQPFAISSLPPLPGSIPAHEQTFSFDFLQNFLGGEVWSSGFYYIDTRKHSHLPTRAYWMLETDNEPFLPGAPGQHGAKLTAFFNETLVDEGMGPSEKNYLNTPVFIRKRGEEGYRYFGMYSQLRYSDKLSYNELKQHVPKKVLLALAEELTESGRPKWVTAALRKAMFPRPEYDGRIPTDSACNTPETTEEASTSTAAPLERRVRKDLEAYAEELKAWEKQSSMKVKMLTKENIMDAFEKEDTATTPGLRLWWEYLQCVGYDPRFYNMLVEISQKQGATSSNKSGSFRRPPTPRLYDDASTDIKKGNASLTKKGKVVRTNQEVVQPAAPTPVSPITATASPAPVPLPESIIAPVPTKPAARKPAIVQKPYAGMPKGVNSEDLKPMVWSSPSWDTSPKAPTRIPVTSTRASAQEAKKASPFPPEAPSQQPAPEPIPSTRAPLQEAKEPAPNAAPSGKAPSQETKKPTALPPHLRPKAPVAAVQQEPDPPKKSNPFSGDLQAAKSFQESATPAQGKSGGRGGGRNGK
ncbi:hypothetical protein HII31_00231 [Pseudocercospora fuligena]|uniref:DUF6697 domain-containing protein n=1 Tax=Pseudocercospora fuligena TaxID=685502 RepID=A0A8H6VQ56_9PEZI|nr:hypothetical protein HII31_00231 [Pseudocercospora fuligena]